MTAQWATVVIVAEPHEVELAVGLLWEAGVAGIEEVAQPDGRVELRAGFEVGRVDHVRRLLTERWTIGIESTDADAGLDGWRAHAAPWRAGDRFVIVPAWQPPPDWVTFTDVVLVVDPDHSFGSGSHPTTRLCLAAIERQVGPGAVVADVGCGSGVLAIAAARRGASSVVAVDVDPGAVVATTRNAERNGVAPLISVSDADVSALPVGSFDVVVANIAAGVLRAMAVDLTGLLGADGVLVLSGLLVEQIDETVACFHDVGLEVVRTEREQDWCALELRRRGTGD